MILYHFTSKYHLPIIMQNGLSRGDVPISGDLSTQAINFTTEGRAHKQKYNRTSYFLYMGEKHLLDKSEIRITVEINDSPLLIHWPCFTKMMDMQPQWLNHLHRHEDNKGDSWWLYFGTIQANNFKKIELNTNGNGAWQTITKPLELDIDCMVFSSSTEIESKKIIRIPQDEFIKTYF